MQYRVTRVQNVIEKIFRLSVVIEVFKKAVKILCTPFANRCLVCSDWALYQLAYLSSTRLDGIHPEQIYLIGIGDSPDHRNVRNKEVKLI